jgi:hypothetical protein
MHPYLLEELARDRMRQARQSATRRAFAGAVTVDGARTSIWARVRGWLRVRDRGFSVPAPRPQLPPRAPQPSPVSVPMTAEAGRGAMAIRRSVAPTPDGLIGRSAGRRPQPRRGTPHFLAAKPGTCRRVSR